MIASRKTEVNLKSGHAMVIEKDVAVPMRDGAVLYADIYRPKKKGRYPAILNISSYQKD